MAYLNETRCTCIALIAVLAVLVSLCGLIFYRQIIAAAGFPPEIREIAETFLRIFAVALGANGEVYVSDTNNNRIQKFVSLVPVRPATWGQMKIQFGPRTP